MTRPRLALLLLLCLTGACSPGAEGRKAPAGDAPNIVLVLVDQLRRDWAEEWLVEVGALADEGVRFDGMRSAAPWTYPSVISMFSGLYPQQHGADGAPDDGRLLSTFSEAVPLFPKTLGEIYDTSAFITNPFLQDWNPLHLAFDSFDAEDFIGNQGPTRGNPKAVWTSHMFADSVNRAVMAHFDAKEPSSTPEFTYVHLIDVHGPWEGAPFETGGALEKNTSEEARHAAARFLDGKILELYRYFLARYDGDLVFLVTSDHGMERGAELSLEPAGYRQRKATVHDFNTRIPFWILPSKRVSGPRVVHGACSNIDIAPTLLEWAGLRSPAPLPGRSLLPAISGAALESRPVYSLMSAFGRRNDCVILGHEKLMRHIDPTGAGPAIKLVYDLERDPAETSPIAHAFGERGRILEEEAGDHGLAFPKRFEPPDDETLRGLQALGYLGGEDDGK
ncbi:MAG TPA: hypothetical protein ENJ09_15775 [Planctomycetes bacterium]|nr:hypothetical protein [Planctomycetota bacterium]